MASVVSAENQASAVAREKAAPSVVVATPNRREFLYYIWGASLALLLGEASAGLIWFALPRFKEGTFGGTFVMTGDKVPAAGSGPTRVPEGRFWMSNVQDEGFVVLYGVCTHLGCLPNWVDTNFRFECPCHGSKYEVNGKYIEGPAPRSLDRFETTLVFADGTQVVQNANGDPIPLEGRTVSEIRINTGKRIRRAGKV